MWLKIFFFNLLKELKIVICNYCYYYFTCLFHFGTFLDAASVVGTPNTHSVNSTAKVHLSVMLTNRRDNDAFTGTTLTGSSEHPNRPLPVSCSFFFSPPRLAWERASCLSSLAHSALCCYECVHNRPCQKHALLRTHTRFE